MICTEEIANETAVDFFFHPMGQGEEKAAV